MAIEEELKALEARYWDALQRKDAAAAGALTDEGCTVVGAQGVTRIDPARIAEMLSGATHTITRYELDDATLAVRKLTEDVAVVSYQVLEDLVVDGKPTSIAAYDASVWVRRDGTWRCALHTESLRGDPFGRRAVERTYYG